MTLVPHGYQCLLQATKEAEHRERLSELKARIDGGKERLAAEEASRRTAKVHHEIQNH